MPMILGLISDIGKQYSNVHLNSRFTGLPEFVSGMPLIFIVTNEMILMVNFFIGKRMARLWVKTPLLRL